MYLSEVTLPGSHGVTHAHHIQHMPHKLPFTNLAAVAAATAALTQPGNDTHQAMADAHQQVLTRHTYCTQHAPHRAKCNRAGNTLTASATTPLHSLIAVVAVVAAVWLLSGCMCMGSFGVAGAAGVARRCVPACLPNSSEVSEE
jgi:hypothetical protein